MGGEHVLWFSPSPPRAATNLRLLLPTGVCPIESFSVRDAIQDAYAVPQRELLARGDLEWLDVQTECRRQISERLVHGVPPRDAVSYLARQTSPR